MPFSSAEADHVRRHAVGHVGDEIGWGQTVFGIGAERLRGDHPVAHGQRGDVLADGRDGSAHLGADDERQLARIQARSGSRCR